MLFSVNCIWIGLRGVFCSSRSSHSCASITCISLSLLSGDIYWLCLCCTCLDISDIRLFGPIRFLFLRSLFWHFQESLGYQALGKTCASSSNSASQIIQLNVFESKTYPPYNQIWWICRCSRLSVPTMDLWHVVECYGKVSTIKFSTSQSNLVSKNDTARRFQIENKANVKRYLAESATHPSVLMWAIGMCTAL